MSQAFKVFKGIFVPLRGSKNLHSMLVLECVLASKKRHVCLLTSQVKVVSLRKLFLPVLLAADTHFFFVRAFLSLIFFAFSYVPNTCVDPPHEMKVVAIQFQPQQKTDGAVGPLAMTAGRDGKFKIWALTEEGKYVYTMCMYSCTCHG